MVTCCTLLRTCKQEGRHSPRHRQEHAKSFFAKRIRGSLPLRIARGAGKQAQARTSSIMPMPSVTTAMTRPSSTCMKALSESVSSMGKEWKTYRLAGAMMMHMYGGLSLGAGSLEWVGLILRRGGVSHEVAGKQAGRQTSRQTAQKRRGGQGGREGIEGGRAGGMIVYTKESYPHNSRNAAVPSFPHNSRNAAVPYKSGRAHLRRRTTTTTTTQEWQQKNVAPSNPSRQRTPTRFRRWASERFSAGRQDHAPSDLNVEAGVLAHGVQLLDGDLQEGGRQALLKKRTERPRARSDGGQDARRRTG